MSVRNYIRNPDFTLPLAPSFHLKSANANVAQSWVVGPGNGGVVDVSFPAMTMGNLALWGFKRNPLRLLELNWSTPPLVGDDDSAHGMPGSHWTFLEHNMHANASDLLGSMGQYYFRAVCFPDRPACRIIPVLEVNRKNGDYTLYPQKPVDVTPNGWATGTDIFRLPNFNANDVIDNTFYVGFHLAFEGLVAPHIGLADFALWRGNASVDDVESRPYELEALIAV